MIVKRIVAAILIGVLGGGLTLPQAIAQTDIPQAVTPQAETPPLPGEAVDTGPPPDPLEPFNEKVFWFNLKLDDYVLRPTASAYNRVASDGVKRGVGRFFRNLGVVERFANNLFQAKVRAAGQEVGRFVINTTMGGVGFFDVASHWLGWEESDEDFGQTLGVYGLASGPYLMLPFFGPSTIRDTVGLAVDSALNPMNYLLSGTQVFLIKTGVAAGTVVNYRAMNMELFADVDRYTVDLYGAVQDAYLQQREKEVQQ